MRTNYPELRDNVNCRSGYNPLKEKHCTKCYPTANHHEFLCKNYHYYCSQKCSVCGRGHHIDLECKDKVETFPPRVGESHLGKLAKKLVFTSGRRDQSPETAFAKSEGRSGTSSEKTGAEEFSTAESSGSDCTNSFSKVNSTDTNGSEFPAQAEVSLSPSDLLTRSDSDEKDNKKAPKAGDQLSDTADANFGITSKNTTSLRTDSASNSSLPSHASTSRDRIFVPGLSGTPSPLKEVSESFMKDLEQDWMDQIKQSHCSESSKSRDLEIIKSLASSLDLIEDHLSVRILKISQSLDSHLGKIWEALRVDASNASKEFPYYLVKNNILYRKYMNFPKMEKHVICLPDELLPAVIHLLHVNHAHSAFAETRGIFRHHFFNRNDGRIIRSYIKACTLCTKGPAKQGKSPQAAGICPEKDCPAKGKN
jgi:hypothetical protein